MAHQRLVLLSVRLIRIVVLALQHHIKVFIESFKLFSIFCIPIHGVTKPRYPRVLLMVLFIMGR